MFASRGAEEARSLHAMILIPRPRQLSLLLLLVGCSCEEPTPPSRRCDLGSSELDATTDATVRESFGGQPLLCRSGWCWEHPRLQSNGFLDAWGGEGEVWLSGEYGTLLRWSGGSWSLLETGTRIPLRAIGGGSRGDVWTIADSGDALHWNGAALEQIDAFKVGGAGGLWVSPEGDVWFASAQTSGFRDPATGRIEANVGPGAVDISGNASAVYLAAGGVSRRPLSGGRFDLLDYDRGISAIDASSEDNVWAASPGRSGLSADRAVSEVVRFEIDGVHVVPVPEQFGREEPVSVVVPNLDEAWVATSNAVYRGDGCRFVQAPTDDATFLSAIASGGPGDLWIGGETGALGRWLGDRFEIWNPGYAGANSDQSTTFSFGWGSVVDGWAVGRREDGAMSSVRWRASRGWAAEPIATASIALTDARAAWSTTDAFVLVGDDDGPATSSRLFRWEGGEWETRSTPLRAEAGYETSSGEVFIVGGRQWAVHHNGAWELGTSGSLPLSGIRGLWGPDRLRAWVVADDGVAAWDGAAWQVVTSAPQLAVHGTSSQDVWTGGSGGQLNHWDGSSWSTFPISGLPTIPSEVIVLSVYAVSTSEAYAVVSSADIPERRSELAQWNGTDWSIVDGLSPRLAAVTGNGADVLLLGSRGSIIGRGLDRQP